MKWIELVKDYFPGVNDEEANDILWGKTGFPWFFNIPKDGATPEACCRKQLQEFKDSIIQKEARTE